MLTTAKRERVKAERAVRVTGWRLGGLIVEVEVTAGKKMDEYSVGAVGTQLVLWQHRTDGQRVYRVECRGGQAVGCDCPHSVYRPGGEPCRHRTESENLMRAGWLGASEAAECVADVPERGAWAASVE